MNNESKRSAFGPSLSLGNYFGIPIRLHWTFGLLLVWVAFVSFAGGHGLISTIISAAFLAAIFICVVLHELGHSLMAKRFGIQTRSITLSPIGGVAALTKMPKHWSHEFWITVAGPAVNIALCILLLPFLILTKISVTDLIVPIGSMTFETFLARLFAANLILAVFNLIPAFPLDGGRIFRSLLSVRLSRLLATRIAARTGQFFAVGFGLLAFMGSPLLLVIAGFVFIAAEGELRAAELEFRLRGMGVGDVMRTRFLSIAETDTLAAISEHVLRTGQRTFPLMDGSRMTGMLEDSAIRQAQDRGELWKTAGDVSQRDFALAQSTDDLLETVEILQGNSQSVMPVFDGTQVVGLLELGSIHLWLALRKCRPAILHGKTMNSNQPGQSPPPLPSPSQS